MIYDFKCPECEHLTLLDVAHVEVIRTQGGCTIAYETTTETENRKYWCEKCGCELFLWNII